MATRNFAYDHPAYLIAEKMSGAAPAGANSNVRFVAHADMQLKALLSRVGVVGTTAGALTHILYKVSGTATTAIATNTLVGTTTSTFSEVALSNAALTRGDELRILNGTDATQVTVHCVEAVVTPGANLTV
jgi:hypothetical protein